MPGTSTSAAEVTHVSRHGFWLLLDGEELLLPFADFPWFRKASIESPLKIPQVVVLKRLSGEFEWSFLPEINPMGLSF